MVERAKDVVALSEAELEEIQRDVETIPDIRQRVDYLINTATRIGANNRTVALKLLIGPLNTLKGKICKCANWSIGRYSGELLHGKERSRIYHDGITDAKT